MKLKATTKALLSAALSLALLLSCLIIPGMTVSADGTTEVQYWNGGTSSTAKDTDGDGYKEIYTAEELAYFVCVGGKYELMNDIWLNDMEVTVSGTTATLTKHSDGTAITDTTTLKEWFGGANPIAGYSAAPWPSAGYDLKGNGNIVNGLYFNNTSKTTKLALFGDPNGSIKVENLGIENCYMITSADYCGVLAGNTSGKTVTISNTYLGESVYHSGTKGCGLIGWGVTKTGSTIDHCYSLATLKSSYGSGLYDGALSGHTWGAVTTLAITNSYSANKAPIAVSGDGVADITSDSCKQVTKTEVAGTKAITALSYLGADFTITEGYPVLKFAIDSNVWGGYSVAPKQDANGTYLITSGEELKYAIYSMNKENANFKLTNDIYLNDINGINWENGTAINNYPIRTWFASTSDTSTDRHFAGSIDGDGHMIYGLYFKTTSSTYSDYQMKGSGLIPTVAKNATVNITNLGLDYLYNNYTNSTGGFIGGKHGYTAQAGITVNMDSCFVGKNAYIKGTFAGALAGAAQFGGTISNCYSLATVENGSHASSEKGLLGKNGSGSTTNPQKLINCYNANGPITSKTVGFSNEWCYESVDGAANMPALTAAMAGGNAVFGDNSANAGNYWMWDNAKWYAVKADGKYPMLRVFGTRMGDANEDGVFEAASDAAGLRKVLINDTEYNNGDYNHDGNVNILDLVAISK